jgi:hypothetical protein
MNTKEYQHNYYLKFRKRILKRCKKYRRTHKKEMDKYMIINKDKILKQKKKYYLKNKEIKLKYRRKYYLINKEKCLKSSKKWARNNKNKINEINRIYQQNKFKIDINYKLKCYLRTRIYLALKDINKSKRTIDLLGCSIEKLKQHLQKQFKSGMSWSNYGKWHVDHIRPCASFDLSRASEQRKCFHYTNLQPLWALENLIKGAK